MSETQKTETPQPKLVTYIVQGQAYYDNATGQRVTPGNKVTLPPEKASYTNGWIVCDEAGEPIKEGADFRRLKKDGPKPLPPHLMAQQASAAPAVDLKPIVELSAKVGELGAKVSTLETEVSALKSRVAELEARPPKK